MRRAVSHCQTDVKHKLLKVDSYIKHKEDLPKSLFMHPQLLKHLVGEKKQYQIKNELFLNTPKSIIFNDFNSIAFDLNYTPIGEGRHYCIKVSPSKTQVELGLYFNNDTKKKYFITKNQAVNIKEHNWKSVRLTVHSKRMSSFAVVKIQVDTMRSQFKAKIRGIPSSRKLFEKQMKDLQLNVTKERVQQILQKRKQQHSNDIQRRASLNSFESVKRMNSSRSLKTAQSKRDLVEFESSKKKYINHIEKMSPERKTFLKNKLQQYKQMKIQNKVKFCAVMNACIFLSQMHKIRINQVKGRLQRFTKQILCKKFAKNLLFYNRMRLTHKARFKQTIHKTTNIIACSLHETMIEKAEDRIGQYFKKILVQKAMNEVFQKTENFMKQVLKVQRTYRKNKCKYETVFKFFCENVLKTKFSNNYERKWIFRCYLTKCRQMQESLRVSFIKNKEELVKLKQEKDEQKERKEKEEEKKKYILDLD